MQEDIALEQSRREGACWERELAQPSPGSGLDRRVRLGPVVLRVRDYQEFVVPVQGRPYVQVAGLIRMWADAHGLAAARLGRPVKYSIVVEPVPSGVEAIDQSHITVKATVESDLVGGPFIGYATSVAVPAEERRDRRRLTAEEANPLEVACTSAIGRALRAAGLDLGTTAEEMREALRRQPEDFQAEKPDSAEAPRAAGVDENAELARASLVAYEVSGDGDFTESFVAALRARRRYGLSDDELRRRAETAWQRWNERRKRQTKAAAQEQQAESEDEQEQTGQQSADQDVEE